VRRADVFVKRRLDSIGRRKIEQFMSAHGRSPKTTLNDLGTLHTALWMMRLAR